MTKEQLAKLKEKLLEVESNYERIDKKCSYLDYQLQDNGYLNPIKFLADPFYFISLMINGTYADYLELEKNMLEKTYNKLYAISNIRKYYEESLTGEDLLLVGLNDDRGFNFQKNYLAILKKMLKSDNYDIRTFDAYSMFFNKMRHIDYYLNHNISLAEIELIKKYGTSNEINHALGDNKIGEFLGTLASNFIESKFNDVPDKKNFKLSTSIKEAKKPIILYSSGINDIMYQSCIDPFSVKGYFKKEKSKYYYALDRVTGDNKEKNMNKIIDGHKSNFEKLLSLNSDSKILVLSAYLYSVGEEYEKSFIDFVILYNERLEKLCKEYQINYIDLRFLEHTKYQSAYHTYFESFSKQVADKIILELSNSINNERTIYNYGDYNYDNEGSRGMLSDMVDYRIKIFETDSEFASRKSQELSREESVIKMLKKN